MCTHKTTEDISQSLVPLIIEASKLGVHAIHCADTNHLALLVLYGERKREDRTLSAKPTLHPGKQIFTCSCFAPSWISDVF